MTPLAKLVYDAIRFSYLGAGEGLGLTDEEDTKTIWPEEFLMDFSNATNDDDWETLAQRVADRIAELEEYEWMYKDLSK